MFSFPVSASFLTAMFDCCLPTEVLEEALVGSDPEGPLCELLFFFLTAIFQALDEEQEEVATDQVEGQTHLLSLLAVHYRKLTNTRKTKHPQTVPLSESDHFLYELCSSPPGLPLCTCVCLFIVNKVDTCTHRQVFERENDQIHEAELKCV